MNEIINEIDILISIRTNSESTLQGINAITMIVFNTDIIREYRKLDIKDIQWYHLGISLKDYYSKDIVIYIDKIGNSKILKNRWGNGGCTR